MAERTRMGERVEHAVQRRAEAATAEHDAVGDEPPGSGRSIRSTAIWLAVTGISLYLVAPSLLDVLDSWRDVGRLRLEWVPVMFLMQLLSFVCLWELQRLALHRAPWGAVITSQLAGNALAKIAPGGGAVGATLQYRMLVESGVRRAEAVSGITAVNVLLFGVVLGLPVLALPAIIRGTVTRSLVETALVGLVVFIALTAVSAAMLAFDAPLRWVGRTLQRIRNRLRADSEPATGLPDRLLRERDKVLATLGERWWRALPAAVGRWAFDYATLLAALAAVGSQPRPILVLLAFCAAQVLAQIPTTPGGLGFVEAGLTATLALAGVSAGNAVLATFSYRLFSYWLPLPAGFVAWLVHRRHTAAAAA